MSFVTLWLAVAGAGAMAIPILIHLLLRRRREPIRWAAMRLLQQALREQSRRMRLEQLVVLALRCLVFLAAGAAVAQPLLRAAGLGDESGGRVVFFVLDDGLLSGLRASERGARSDSRSAETALRQQVARAESVIATLRPGDAVGLVTASRPATGVLVPPTTDLSAVATLLKAIAPSDAPSDVPGALAVLREAVDRVPEGRPVAAYLLSDLRRGSASLETALPPLFVTDSGEGEGFGERELQLLVPPPADAPVDNAQIVAVEPLRRLLLPGQTDGSGQVSVRVGRFGALPAATQRVTVSGPGIAASAPKSFRWNAGQAETTVDVLVETDDTATNATDSTPGEAPRLAGMVGLVARLDADLLPADDQRAAVLQSRRAVRVVLLDRRSFNADVGLERLSSGQWLARALRPSDAAPLEIVVEDPTRLEPRALRGADVVVVARPDLLDDAGWSAIRALVARGGLALVAPPDELRAHPWLDRMQATLRMPWSIELEAIDVGAAGGNGDATTGGLALDQRQPSSALLRLLEGELSELVEPVRVFRRLNIDTSAAPSDVVLVAADGGALIVAGSPGESDRAEGGAAGGAAAGGAAASSTATLPGLLVLLAFSPELAWTDLPTKPLMVPLIQEIVRQGVGLGGRSTEALVGERVATSASTVDLQRIDERATAERAAGRDSDDRDASVAVEGGRSAALRRAGLYRAVDIGGQSSGLVAVNVDPAAGDPTPQPADAVLAWLRSSGAWKPVDAADLAAPLGQVEVGSSMAWVLLAVALAAAVLESIFSRRFSHASIRRGDQHDSNAAGSGAANAAGGAVA